MIQSGVNSIFVYKRQTSETLLRSFEDQIITRRLKTVLVPLCSAPFLFPFLVALSKIPSRGLTSTFNKVSVPFSLYHDQINDSTMSPRTLSTRESVGDPSPVPGVGL